MYRVAGSISIPSKAWPIIVLIFFVFLAPGASFILNVTTALIAYACKLVIYWKIGSKL